ncbi:murein biosynthesis integral membrane protein MurJ [Desulfovibrio mangrovi]|uniref:murein biosynthesis integral membrane protein MurJ n=1 Tax=Desulfovibrio mangrovi TaxID=2976983 RepID=UPI002247B842|nr:murein biosynthesis integral membrane protein MurJ [Desulfovibrio mangrovi]UZP67885.1 murein biosynthesis integral membrane protein MurJ [Desulfovibrio mangrovi]
MGILTGRHRMGTAALIMAGSVFLSRFMGLIRDKFISYYHGASVESDIYFTSFVIPDFLNYLLAGGYFSITLIPLLAEYFERDEREGWQFLSAVLCWVALVASLLTGAAWMAAPWLSKLAAPGFDTASLERLASFLRIILPAQVFFLIGACLSGVLYMRRQFSVPALTPLVYNACIILGGWLMIDSGMEGFCWGVLGGAAVGSFLLPLMAVRSGGGMRLSVCFRHAGVWRFMLLALPLMIGQSIVVLDEQFVRIFGSLTGDGAVSLLNYARRIMQVPVGVVAQAAGVASYPFLASLVAKRETAQFNSTLNTALRNTMLIIVPLSAWMIAAAEPTLRLIFQQGGFGAEQTLGATPLLQVMLAAVAFWGIQQIMGRAFYAHKDTVTPAVVGTVATALALPVYWWLANVLGALGVALAGSCSVVLYTVMLSAVWRRRFGGEAFADVPMVLAKVVVLSLPAAVSGWWTVSKVGGFFPQAPLTGAFMALAASGLLFCVVYAVVVRLFAPSMLSPVMEMVRRKLRR